MPSVVTNVTFSAGYITLHKDGEPPVRHSIAAVLRALDIPTGLTFTQVASIKALANLIVILIRTLIDREVLNESFLEDDDYSLDALIEAIEAMGGSYHEPGLEDADA